MIPVAMTTSTPIIPHYTSLTHSQITDINHIRAVWSAVVLRCCLIDPCGLRLRCGGGSCPGPVGVSGRVRGVVNVESGVNQLFGCIHDDSVIAQLDWDVHGVLRPVEFEVHFGLTPDPIVLPDDHGIITWQVVNATTR